MRSFSSPNPSFSPRLLPLLHASLFLSIFASFSLAHDFTVGGQSGWMESPAEGFNHWAERHRFQINDQLVFKYNKSEDSVLLVNKQNYDSCNSSKPIKRLGESSVFRLFRSGFFYFMSGEKGRCEKGQKLVVVVMAERRKRAPFISPAKAPAMAAAGIDGMPELSASSASKGLLSTVIFAFGSVLIIF